MLVVHDWRTTAGRWGCDFAIQPLTPDGHRVRVNGWKYGIREGHVLLFRHAHAGKEYDAGYTVESVRYERDPKDQFSLVGVYRQGLVAEAAESLSRGVSAAEPAQRRAST